MRKVEVDSLGDAQWKAEKGDQELSAWVYKREIMLYQPDSLLQYFNLSKAFDTIFHNILSD